MYRRLMPGPLRTPAPPVTGCRIVFCGARIDKVKEIINPKWQKPRQRRGFFTRWLAPKHPVLLGYNVRCAGAFGTLLDIEGYGLSFGQGFETSGLDGIVVDEYVFRTIGRSDKAKAFFVTEPLHCTCSHWNYLF